MPNLAAAKKSLRTDKRKHQQNLAVKSGLKTLIKTLNNLIAQQKQKEASLLLRDVVSALDKAAKKGVIKKNAASRKKSRLSAKVSKISKP